MPTTGQAILPDIGELEYNTVTFTQLYTSHVQATQIQDASNRTVKQVDYQLTVDGVVTLDIGGLIGIAPTTIDKQLETIRERLSKNAGVLKYTSKGFGDPLVINQPGGRLRDVNWGPKPKILEFVPLGASLAAKIKWTVVFSLPEMDFVRYGSAVLQFNQQSEVHYDDAGYTTVRFKGTLEIPLTRASVNNRDVTRTVDDFRRRYMERLATQFDLTRFRVTDRIFPVSLDCRTMEFSFTLEELPPMGLPAGITMADGDYDVKPTRPGASIQRWMCTLRGRYIVPKGSPRRLAYLAFLNLWNFRMLQSQVAPFEPNQQVQPLEIRPPLALANGYNQVAFANPALAAVPPPSVQPAGVQNNPQLRSVIPVSFTVREGIYLGSREISFTATWELLCSLKLLLAAAGVWRQSGIEGGNLWATSVRNISGWRSWLQNRVDADSLVIVDFGSPT